MSNPSNSHSDCECENQCCKPLNNPDPIISFQQNLSQYSFLPSNPSGSKHHALEQDRARSRTNQHRSFVPKESKVKRRRASEEEEEHGSKASPCSAHELTYLANKPAKKPKVKQPNRGYAPPERYSHLRHINDCLLENLDIVFCGINPGQRSAETGHHFAHPSNHFWKCLHLSGLTPQRIHPTEDYTLPEKFSLGLVSLTLNNYKLLGMVNYF
ncbi:hypothetical protein E1B28_006049 [Marasmius oreades]|uniref:Uracil-DNA glycosylase-like domain-containing protein n=1 Tax=Marasmius oreades TaxID=181124 RepID=A0A9P7S4E2_9AGAR|nr:uncharacterized protein E1B28_006049 [Marasmius oreades]KAG7095276.1 hypothetical protein E1B28_006049 [Marasmius oreades]